MIPRVRLAKPPELPLATDAASALEVVHFLMQAAVKATREQRCVVNRRSVDDIRELHRDMIAQAKG